MKKLLIFGLALFAVVATAILMTPVAIADDPVCFLFYTSQAYEGPFEINAGNTIEMVADAGDDDYVNDCSDAFDACWDEGYRSFIYDESWNMC